MNAINLTLKVLGLFLALMPIHAAFANGGSDGGGGGAMICYYPNGTVRTAELLDLWEARHLKLLWEKSEIPYRLHIPYLNEPVQVQIARAMAKLRQIDPLLADRVQKDLDFVQQPQNQHLMEKGLSIEPPRDAQNVYYETGCKLDGMLWFDKDLNKLSIKQEIFSKSINNTVIAASFTHEAIYKTLREIHRIAGDSEPVRKINACLYATDDCFGLLQHIPTAKNIRVFSCRSSVHKAIVTAEPLSDDPSNPDMIPHLLKIQLNQLGSVTYPVPVTVETVMYLNRDGSDSNPVGYDHRVYNRAFDLYLRTQNEDNALVGDTSPISIATFPMRSATEFSANYSRGALTLSIPMLKVIYNGVTIPGETFTCTLN